MEDTLIKFETAKLAKEKRFNELCDYYVYNHESNNIISVEDTNRQSKKGRAFWFNEYGQVQDKNSTIRDSISNCEGLGEGKDILTCIPTQSLLQKWLRKVHNLLIIVDINPDVYNAKVNYSADIKNCDKNSDNLGIRILDGFTIYQSYEEALEKGLYEALKLIKNV